MIATRRLSDWVPGVEQLRRYQRAWLRGDVIAGLTVTAYLVPQVMAYSTLAGLPAVTGLWAAIVALTVYVLFGSSRQLSVGPESTTALMTAAVLAPMASGDSVRYGILAAILAVLVGAVCFFGALARLGFLANMLSRPVLVGYMTGIAILMIASQLGKITGASNAIVRPQYRPMPLADDGPGGIGSASAARVWALGTKSAGSIDCGASVDRGCGRAVVADQRN
jgi:SulP family sulfate permease